MGCCPSKDKHSTFNENEPLDLIAYDFDKTITSKHLYFALTSLGASDADEQLEEVGNMEQDDLIHIFGGMHRVQRLQTHFKLLSSTNTYIAIISFGFENVIKKALQRLDMLQYFNERLIIGNDTKILEDVYNNKALCLQRIIKENVTENKNRMLFVDDDINNISSVKDMNIAGTLWISERNGISDQQMKMIERRVGSDTDKIVVKTDDLDALDEQSPTVNETLKDEQ